ncbi:uncharacterized protein ColSpa_05770 [Colletotrichum spaethianum]|uniref:Uncharacterized protein n=1 Tax=Colletotrichum spaethianum TaxID=700344 RepID=A0AA37P7T5_9PEZI|nr:uncharacterized protein ColSpa_05770 [Colletotrichum spaethianum]GKT45589.1 hypothetical protein ColSpa_05770 [Colletotrichum spaethianum]
MASQYDEGPELAPQHQYPEVYHPPPQQSQPSSPQPIPVTPMKHEDSTYGKYSVSGVDQSTYGGTQYHPAGGEAGQQKKRICGCTFLVFLLSVIIAILAAAVIGLAAGTGVEASRANQALNKLAALEASAPNGTTATATATVTVTSASPTATGFASLTNNCSNSDETTTGQTYTTDCKLTIENDMRSSADLMHLVFGKKTFVQFCNSNAPNAPLMSLFTANFDNCMDACAAFSNYESGFDGNATCQAVSFIPLWTTRAGAVAGKAPGNCYLKPGPQTRDKLETPNIGTECHAAIMNS